MNAVADLAGAVHALASGLQALAGRVAKLEEAVRELEEDKTGSANTMSIHAYLTEILGTAPQHDLNMPHDVRYPGEIRGCPPNCPYRLGMEEAAALAGRVLRGLGEHGR